MDWAALSVIFNIFFAGALVVVNWYYNNKTMERAQMDRLREEMDLLIAPLYAKSRMPTKGIYFLKGSPGYIDNSSYRVQQYFEFWENVQRYKYLGSDYLRLAIDEYMNKKTNDVLDRVRDPEYETAESKLLEDVERRYGELTVLIH